MDIIFCDGVNRNVFTRKPKDLQYNGMKFIFDYRERVPDSIRGILRYQDNCWMFFVEEFEITDNNLEDNILAILLESPHKSEYDRSTGEPLLPAQGHTGERINLELTSRGSIMNCLNVGIEYQVILINPIQYQASGHKILFAKGLPVDRNVTNMIFRALFSKRGHDLRQDFIDRLKKYDPDVIVNCCTYSLKGVVRQSVIDAGYICCVEDYHPSKWL